MRAVVLAAGVWAGSMLVSPVPMSAGLCLAAAVVAVTAAPPGGRLDRRRWIVRCAQGGLVTNEKAALRAMGEDDLWITAAELAAVIGANEATGYRILERFLTQGLVVRRWHCPEDDSRPVRVHQLTAAGWAKAAELMGGGS